MKKIISILAIVSGLTLSSLATANSSELNVYSARKEALIKPALDKFTAKTGIKVNLLTGKADALISRLKNEGSLTQADVLITTDVGRLYRAKSLGLTQAIQSTTLVEQIDAHLRDPEQHWFGLTKRARTFVYAGDKVKENQLSTLEALATNDWKNRVCIRSSSNIYNQSLVAALIAQQGETKTQQWANDFVNSFARPPKGGDRDQVKAVAAGVCDVAIANSYYVAAMFSNTEQKQLLKAKNIKVFWPNQNDRGTHINISGAAVTKYAKNKEAAQQLIEFMMTKEIQAWYAETNHEYPVHKDVPWSGILKDFGQFKAEDIQLDKVGLLNGQAVKVMDKAGWK